MKRLDFLKTIGSSLFQTVHSVYEPFIRDDFQKVEEAADNALGIKWMSEGIQLSGEQILELRFLRGEPVIIFANESNMQAFKGICPVCSNIIILTTLYSSGKCLNCEKEYNFQKQSGDLLLESLLIKKKENQFYIGYKRQNAKGDKYA